jgi:hypothetical protein
MWESASLAEDQIASQKGLCSIGLVISTTSFIFTAPFSCLVQCPSLVKIMYIHPGADADTRSSQYMYSVRPATYVTTLHSVTAFLLWDSTHGHSTHSPLNCPPERETRMLTNPLRIVPLQKLTAAQLVNTHSEYYGTRGVLHQMNPVNTIVYHLRTILILFSRVRLSYPSSLLPTSFRTLLHYCLPPCVLQAPLITS